MNIYKPKEFADMIGISVRTLQRWDNECKLKAFRNPSNRRYYTQEQYEEYMKNTKNDGYDKLNEVFFKKLSPLIKDCMINDDKEFLSKFLKNGDIEDKDHTINYLINCVKNYLIDDSHKTYVSSILAQICMNYESNLLGESDHYPYLEKSKEDLQDDINSSFCKFASFLDKLSRILSSLPGMESKDELDKKYSKIDELKDFIKEK